MNGFIKCRECKDWIPPNFMLWNEVCVFCWFHSAKWRGKTKEEIKMKKKIPKDYSMKYDPNSKIYKEAKTGKTVNPKDIKSKIDFGSAIAGILHS